MTAIQSKFFEDIEVGELIWSDGKMLGFVCGKREDTDYVFVARTPYGRGADYPTSVKVKRKENANTSYIPYWYYARHRRRGR